MNAINESLENDHGDTNKYILLEPHEKEKYSIRINKTANNILIEATPMKDSNAYYKIELSLNDFYLLSKGFKMFDNLDEICEALQNIFISNKASVIKKTNSFLIILKINLIGGKEQEINIELNFNTMNKDIIDANIIKINKLENEIKEIKSKNDMLLKKIIDLEDVTKAQNNEINNLKYTIGSQNKTN